MVHIVFDIPNQYVNRIVVALKKKYFELIMPKIGPGGMTDPQLAKEAIRLWVIQVVKSSEQNDAINDIVIDVPDEIIEGTIQSAPK